MKRTVIYLLSLALVGVLEATPEIASFSLRSGTNLPRVNGEAVRGMYDIKNPDDTAADLTIQVVPEGGRTSALYYRRLTLPPHTGLTGFFPLVFCEAPSCTYRLIQHRDGTDVELMHDDLPLMANRAAVTAAAAASTGSWEENRLEPEDYLYVGSLRKYNSNSVSLPALNRERDIDNAARFLSFSTDSATLPPSSLAEYSSLGAMFLAEEKYHKMTVPQLSALRDYVRFGGYVIVSGPAATQGLYDSPLRELLPVVPAGVRRLEDGNSLRRAWGFPARQYATRDANGDLQKVPGYDYAEAMVSSGTKVLRTMDGIPMMAVRTYGLGTVLWIAFDPVEFITNEPEARAVIWNELLRPANFIAPSLRPDSQLRLEQVQQQLLGYSIPPFSTLGKYLLAYIAAGAIALVLFSRFKHPALGWGVVCVLGVVFTLLIVSHAHNLSADQPQRQISRITMRVWDGAAGPQSSFANLTSRGDLVLDLALDNATDFLFPTPEKTSIETSETALERSRLLVSTSSDDTTLMRMSLQENRPRAANWIRLSRTLETPLGDSLPVLQIAADGALRLPEWEVPEELRPYQRAMLLLPGAIRGLDGSAGRLGGIVSESVENDTVLVQVQEYLAARQLRSPAVCLVSIERADEPEAGLRISCDAGAFKTYDYTLTLIPLKLEWPTEGDTFTIPAELTWMTVDNNSLLSRFWAFGECTGLPLNTSLSANGALNKRSSTSVPINLPLSAPQGELLQADVHYSLVENSSLMDIQTRLFSTDDQSEGVAPTAATAQSSQFKESCQVGYDAARARFTVNFVPMAASAQPQAVIESGSSSSREQSWWLHDAHAALLFRRNHASPAN